ncbi:unnamed protein product [Urochloa humidicola]
MEEELAYVDVPAEFTFKGANGAVLMPSREGSINLVALYRDRDVETSIKIWETQVAADGRVDWVQKETIHVAGLELLGVAATSLLIRTPGDALARLELGTGRFHSLARPESGRIGTIVPFLSFHTPGSHQAVPAISDAHGAEDKDGIACTSRTGHDLHQ